MASQTQSGGSVATADLYSRSGAAAYGLGAEQFAQMLDEIQRKYIPKASSDEKSAFCSGLRVEELALARGCAQLSRTCKPVAGDFKANGGLGGLKPVCTAGWCATERPQIPVALGNNRLLGNVLKYKRGTINPGDGKPWRLNRRLPGRKRRQRLPPRQSGRLR